VRGEKKVNAQNTENVVFTVSSVKLREERKSNIFFGETREGL